METGVTCIPKKFQPNRRTKLNSNGVHQFKSSEVSSLVRDNEAVIQINSSGIPLDLALLDRTNTRMALLHVARSDRYRSCDGGSTACYFYLGV